MYRKLVPLVAAIATWASGSLYAADTAVNARLTQLQGTVLMNQGQKFVPAKLDTELSTGDRVLALKTGLATVTFPDGCAVLIKPGKLTTIGPQSPCAADVTAKEPEDGGLAGGDSSKPPIPIYVGGTVLAGMIISCYGFEEWPCEDSRDRDHRRTVSP